MSDFEAHETAEISEQARIGKGTRIWHYVQIREAAQIGDNCTIGKSSYIDVGVRIGNNVKIQNGVSVYQGVTVEDDVLLGPFCTFTNDPYPRAFSVDWEVVPTVLKKGCSIGANATVVCGITIAEYSLIAAGAVVTEDTLPFSLMIGSPARLKAFVCLCGRELRKIKGDTPRLELRCDSCGRALRVEFEMIEAEIGRK